MCAATVLSISQIDTNLVGRICQCGNKGWFPVTACRQGTDLAQRDTGSEWMFWVRNIVFITDVDILQRYLNIIDDFRHELVYKGIIFGVFLSSGGIFFSWFFSLYSIRVIDQLGISQTLFFSLLSSSFLLFHSDLYAPTSITCCPSRTSHSTSLHFKLSLPCFRYVEQLERRHPLYTLVQA